jgi:excisionase family DNA binding protein
MNRSESETKSVAAGASVAEPEPVGVLYLEDAVLIDVVGEAMIYKWVPGDEYAPAKPHVLLYERASPPEGATAEVLADARRYRWLRSVGPRTPFGLCATNSDGALTCDSALDKEVDEQMKKARPMRDAALRDTPKEGWQDEQQQTFRAGGQARVSVVARLMKVSEAAQPLGCSPRQVRRIIAAGKLSVVRLGRSSKSDRIHPDDLQDYINRERRARPCQSKSVETASKLLSAGKARSIAAVLATGRAIRLVRSKPSS